MRIKQQRRYIISILGTSEELFDEQLFFEYMDPRTGNLWFTPTVASAKCFESTAEAMAAWKAVPTEFPVRADGKPNRPLSAYTIAIAPEGSLRRVQAEKGDQVNSGDSGGEHVV